MSQPNVKEVSELLTILLRRLPTEAELKIAVEFEEDLQKQADKIYADYKNSLYIGISDNNSVAIKIDSSYNIKDILMPDIVKVTEDLKENYPKMVAAVVDASFKANKNLSEAYLKYARDTDLLQVNAANRLCGLLGLNSKFEVPSKLPDLKSDKGSENLN